MSWSLGIYCYSYIKIAVKGSFYCDESPCSSFRLNSAQLWKFQCVIYFHLQPFLTLEPHFPFRLRIIVFATTEFGRSRSLFNLNGICFLLRFRLKSSPNRPPFVASLEVYLLNPSFLIEDSDFSSFFQSISSLDLDIFLPSLSVFVGFFLLCIQSWSLRERKNFYCFFAIKLIFYVGARVWLTELKGLNSFDRVNLSKFAFQIFW